MKALIKNLYQFKEYGFENKLQKRRIKRSGKQEVLTKDMMRAVDRNTRVLRRT